MATTWVHTFVGVLATVVAGGSLLLASTQNVTSDIQADEYRRPVHHRVIRSEAKVIEDITSTSDEAAASSYPESNFQGIPKLDFSSRRWKTSGGGGSGRKLSVGGYSRIYSEKRYQVNRTKHQEKHSNRSIETETRLTFHRLTPGQLYGPFGMHKISVRNNTISNGDKGSAEFSNVTYFFQKEIEDRGDDKIHPLTHFNRKLFRKETIDDGGYNPPIHPCDQGSCYPATGNLLIGREDKLFASSTCGLSREERYCIVSHLEDKKKCFKCDSRAHQKRNPGLSHRIENVISRLYPGTQQRSWWQSENGVEDVSIQVDLEAEFHFTHLIITFKTFRPAAMLIERSFDEGKSWMVYRYFADNCTDQFPEVDKGPATNLTHVVCEERYSGVAPSTEGEVIFRVLPKNVVITDPYAQEVQNLLKVTNLRIHFKKLHTLGDDLLDKRVEIQEKYYYSIYEMVVRGSCSCYGHASRCLPMPGVETIYPDMVHGRCECTHNTKGLNCHECEEFYWDLPWKPAIGKQTNACKKCNCNNHAHSCHFDNAVFEASGNVSGGVCDNCMHNTMGHKCEQCKPFFYLQPGRRIDDIDACQMCDCDPRGSLDDGVCISKTDLDNNLEAGNCHCKTNVIGRRCDHCEHGFWNLTVENPDGCEECTCNLHGTVENLGCNVLTGECTCKRYVTGRDCNQCLPEYYGLSDDRDGCKACDCDVGGAYDNLCDVVTGQCRCRPHFMGRNCSSPEQGYFAGLPDHILYEGELAERSPNTQIVIREPYRDGRDNTWTGVGFIRVYDDSWLEFDINDVVRTMPYDLVVRYEPQQPGYHLVNVQVIPDSPPDPNVKCEQNHQYQAGPTALTGPATLTLRSESREETLYPPLCLEAGKNYKVRLSFAPGDKPGSPVLIDSIAIIPKTENLPFFHGSDVNDYRRQLYERYRCNSAFVGVSRYPLPDECKKILTSVGGSVFDGAFECGCDLQGSTSAMCDTLGGQCNCKPNVMGRRCERCAPGTFGFESGGCRPCECNPIGSLDNFCDAQSGQCRCRPNTFGIHCDQCQPGYWNFPNCQQCTCNGHADICDSVTGHCIECRDSTTGTTCDRCVESYYGDPRLGVDIPCRPCPCPGTIDGGHSFATRCALDKHTNDVICECEEGYAGPRCDTCGDNYFGNPEIPGGECRSCSCNNNIDISRPGNCDLKTGQCLQCLFYTEGFGCENCMPGFYGDAINQMCRNCVCDILGTDVSAGPCHRETGQCPCLPNVIGLSCDECRVDHWKIASGEGCEACDCDPIGSISTQCNSYHGQCQCKAGFGGRKCDQCQSEYWGDPNVQCYPCDCNTWGSQTLQCDRVNGSCVCITGVGGHKCDTCARGFIGNAPNCRECGECFNNWDLIMHELKDKTTRVVDAASQVKQQGAAGAYTRDFKDMKDRVEEVNRLLESSAVSSSDLDELNNLIDEKKKHFDNTSSDLDKMSDELTNISERILRSNSSLSALEVKVDALKVSAASLKDQAINLQEANVEGALNLTREAKRRSDESVRRADGVQKLISDSERQRRRIEALLLQISPQMNKTKDDVSETLKELENDIDGINALFPGLNNLVCDREGNPCDSFCGGAGCGKCGGIACEGAVTNAYNALNIAQDAHDTLKKKDADAEDLLRAVTQTKSEVDEARNLALMAFDETQTAKDTSEAAKAVLEQLEGEIKDIIEMQGASPEEIRKVAEDVMSKNITLQPEQIETLAQGIRESASSLTDIEQILRATQSDLQLAKELKDYADHAASEAEKVLQDALQVREELDKSLAAQKNADDAREKAKEHFDVANLDLKQIGSETLSADHTATGSLTDIEGLKYRLVELQKKNLQNERRRDQARNESESALRNATLIQETTSRLKDNYDKVSRDLESKLALFKGAKKRDELQNGANTLANNISDKLKELQEMQNEYGEHESRAEAIAREIDMLTLVMEEHLRAIRKIEEYHRTCNS